MARATDPLTGHGREFVLVLDDVQVLRSRGAIEVLTALVEDPPPGAQLVLASRCEPPLPLGRLRAHREVLELTPRDFVMTRGEAAALLELAGAELGAADVDALVRRTEGWPAGLYLAAVSLRDQPDTAAAIARFGGDDRVVSDYVADCAAVRAHGRGGRPSCSARRCSTGSRGRCAMPCCWKSGSAGTLRDLARANALVVPLDRTDEWYRYHGLLGADAAGRAAPARARSSRHELHRRASRWYADHGDVDAAIRHAAAAGDVAARGRSAVGQRLPLHPPGPQRDRPSLARSLHRRAGGRLRAAGARGRQRPPGRRRPRSRRALDRRGRPRARRRAGPAPGAGRRGRRRGDARGDRPRRRAAHARRCRARLRAGCRTTARRRSMDRLLEGTACHLLGARERAHALLEEGSRRGVVGAPSVNALCLAQLALLALDRDDWALATELAARARSQIERFRLAAYPTMSLVLAVAALTQAQRGRVQAATEDGAEATRLLDAMDDFVPWYVAEVRIVLARAALRLSDVVGARALVEGAALAVRATPDAPVLGAWLEDASAQVEAYSTSGDRSRRRR